VIYQGPLLYHVFLKLSFNPLQTPNKYSCKTPIITALRILDRHPASRRSNRTNQSPLLTFRNYSLDPADAVYYVERSKGGIRHRGYHKDLTM
jgi:hypothetical protein